jgi:hypothetical protein
VTYTVQQNVSPTPRTGRLTIAGLPFTVTQQAANGCTYSLSPSPDYFDYTGGPDTITVSTQPGCVWSATTKTRWVTITSTPTGTGTGTFDISVQQSSLRGTRNGSIAVADQTLTVSQTGNTGCRTGCL